MTVGAKIGIGLVATAVVGGLIYVFIIRKDKAVTAAAKNISIDNKHAVNRAKSAIKDNLKTINKATSQGVKAKDFFTEEERLDIAAAQAKQTQTQKA